MDTKQQPAGRVRLDEGVSCTLACTCLYLMVPRPACVLLGFPSMAVVAMAYTMVAWAADEVPAGAVTARLLTDWGVVTWPAACAALNAAGDPAMMVPL